MGAPGARTEFPSGRRRLLFPESWPPAVLSAMLVSVAVVFVYAGTFSAPFVFDDLSGIVGNPAIQHLWPFARSLRPASGAGEAGWPLTSLSLALNHAAGGLDVRGYQVVNVGLHCVASLLLFAVLRLTFGQRVFGERTRTAAVPVALAVALLWALHPLQTEAVSRVIHRGEMLGAICFLSTLYAFGRAAQDSGVRIWPWLAVLACALGMAASPVMVALPALVLLYDRTFLAGTIGEAWRRRRGLHLALAATWMILVFVVGWLGPQNPGAEGAASGWWLTQCRAMAVQLKLAFWPQPLVLDYGDETASGLSAGWPQLAIVALLVVATFVALVRRPLAGFAGAFFLLTLLPRAAVFPVVDQPIGEYRMYLPLAGVVVAVVAGLHAWQGRRGVVVALLLAAVLGDVSFRRNADYRSALTIWRDTTTKAPSNARAHYHLGNALSDAGRAADAVTEYETALRLRPRYGAAHFNLGGLLVQLGRESEAVTHFEAAIRLGPDSPELRANLAAALVRLGQIPEATSQFEAAAKLGLAKFEEESRYGQALAEVGRFDEALTHLTEAVRLKPDDAGARVVLGMVLSAMGRAEDGLKQFFTAVHLNPGDPGAQSALGDALLEGFRPAEALPHYEMALRLAPARAAILQTSMGNALSLLGRVPDAVAHYEEALRLNPDNTEARARLAMIQAAAARRAGGK